MFDLKDIDQEYAAFGKDFQRTKFGGKLKIHGAEFMATEVEAIMKYLAFYRKKFYPPEINKEVKPKPVIKSPEARVFERPNA